MGGGCLDAENVPQKQASSLAREVAPESGEGRTEARETALMSLLAGDETRIRYPRRQIASRPGISRATGMAVSMIQYAQEVY